MLHIENKITEAINTLELRITLNSLTMSPHKFFGQAKIKEGKSDDIDNSGSQNLTAQKVIEECNEAIEKLHLLKSYSHRTQKEAFLKILNNYRNHTLEEIKTTLRQLNSKLETT